MVIRPPYSWRTNKETLEEKQARSYCFKEEVTLGKTKGLKDLRLLATIQRRVHSVQLRRM